MNPIQDTSAATTGAVQMVQEAARQTLLRDGYILITSVCVCGGGGEVKKKSTGNL